MRASSLIAVVAVMAAMSLCRPNAGAAAERSVFLLAPSADDDRIAPAREAVAFWNDRLEELGVEARLAGPRVVVASPVTRTLENYARNVAQRGVRLPGGEAEPDAPRELTGLGADIVVLLSRQDILSYTWPLPRIDPPRYLIVIRLARGLDRGDAMVSRHVVAHEFGHALGLQHNDAAHTLMCGPCQPLSPSRTRPGSSL